MYYHYLIHFSVALVIGALFCIGLWISRDGEMEKLPNGEEKYKWRMILYPFYRWLTSPYTEKEYYFEKEMKELIIDINKWFPSKIIGYMEMDGILAFKLSDLHKQEWNSIACELEDKYEVKIHITENNVLQAWKQYERSNEWAKPIIGCFKCYASFWGTIIFTLVTAFSIRTNFIPLDLFILIPMWILYCFSLVVVNVLVHKLTQD